MQTVSSNQSLENAHNLTQDDRLSLIAAALDARVRDSESDCSHLVHAIYDSAGFPYAYAPSSDLYAGVEGFQRVKQPEPGDLIVWRGHAGIVIKPSQHIFFSFMTSGPGIDDYQAPYWKGRGHPRFYRYIKDSSCTDCDSAHRSHRLLKIKR
jgi:cell wall-associated NlpC family hydrolase